MLSLLRLLFRKIEKRWETMHQYLKYPFLDTKIKILHEENHFIECLFTPLEKNFSLVFANLLRRVLYSYTIGHSITAIKIQGIHSEFESIPGVVEDTVDILSNLKNLTFKIEKPIQECILRIQQKGAKKVRGENIICPEGVSVLSKEVDICTMNDSANVEASLLLQSGTGYYFNNIQNLEKGYMPLDTSFSPIEHVSYRVQTYSHYEELAFYLKTNGSIRAKEALSHAFEFLGARYTSLYKQSNDKT